MKKNKKHKFYHADPEKIGPGGKKSKEATKSTSDVKIPDEYGLIKKDLKRTVITITVFIAIVVALFLIQQKTNVLQPILSKFGL